MSNVWSATSSNQAAAYKSGSHTHTQHTHTGGRRFICRSTGQITVTQLWQSRCCHVILAVWNLALPRWRWHQLCVSWPRRSLETLEPVLTRAVPQGCLLLFPSERRCCELLLQLWRQPRELPGGCGWQPHAGRVHPDLLHPHRWDSGGLQALSRASHL